MAKNYYAERPSTKESGNKYAERPKSEDNINYGTKKYFKQSFKKYADIVEKGLKEGYGDLSQADINVMSSRFNELVDSGADKSDAERQMKSIVREYMLNKKLKSEGKNIVAEKKKLFKDI